MAHGISWVSGMPNPVFVYSFFFWKKCIWYDIFQGFFSEGPYHFHHLNFSADIFLISIPLLLGFVLTGVLFWDTDW
jgi:hypothetical protein